jgi:hypothetical protein
MASAAFDCMFKRDVSLFLKLVYSAKAETDKQSNTQITIVLIYIFNFFFFFL